MPDGIVHYYCESCKSRRQTVILPDIHSINLAASANGIVVYSDIHTCRDGILGVSNIHIDTNYAVRGVEYLHLPKSAILLQEQEAFAVPVPSSPNLVKNLPITDLIPGMNVRFIYKNLTYHYEIKIGSIQKNDPVLYTVPSPSGNSLMEYYECDIEFTPWMQKNVVTILDHMEDNPPIRLGFILEALIHVLDKGETLEEPDIRAMADMFCSHKIQVQLVDQSVDDILEKIGEKFDDNLASTLKLIIADISINPEQLLIDLAGIKPGFIKLLFNLYILQKMDIVNLRKVEIEMKEEIRLQNSLL